MTPRIFHKKLLIIEWMIRYFLLTRTGKVLAPKMLEDQAIRKSRWQSTVFFTSLQIVLYTMIFLIFLPDHPMTIPTAIGAGVAFAMYANVERFVRS
jgi:hypothetical protein